ncbi:unnamed protein product [Rotaria sp. Silwood1]|nr:unnamed protein product [Rotaria sp. Silwood1]CAF3629533.1 unnamed protein product [Rotaria sp. Silwood1]
MANKNDNKDIYYERLARQKQYFSQNFGCSTSPSFYYIHFHDGHSHWMKYQWGWNLSYLNLDDGDPTPCGKCVFGFTALCERCYRENRDKIQVLCQQFDKEIKENHQETIQDIIQDGRKIKITYFK